MKLSLDGTAFFPSPLVGEGGSPRSGETGEGSLSANASLAVWIETPHPALRATFSHKGRRECSVFAAANRKTSLIQFDLNFSQFPNNR
jgi:hypothetical protein